MDYVTLEWKKEGFVMITLNRPQKLNAINREMVSELDRVLDRVNNATDLTFVVITGKGDRAFCAGGDLNDFHGELSASEAYALLSSMKNVLFKLATLKVPTVALLNGQARGGGCEIATACDFRYAVDGSSFGFIQGNLGIVPGFGGGALLYERMKRDSAAYWLVTSKVYSAEEAFQLGWLHKIISLDEWSHQELLEEFINKTPAQMRWFKQQYLNSVNLDEWAVRMEEETRICSQLWESEEHKEAVRKFMSSRKN